MGFFGKRMNYREKSDHYDTQLRVLNREQDERKTAANKKMALSGKRREVRHAKFARIGVTPEGMQRIGKGAKKVSGFIQNRLAAAYEAEHGSLDRKKPRKQKKNPYDLFR